MVQIDNGLLVYAFKHPEKLGDFLINNLKKRGITINTIFNGRPIVRQITLESTTKCTLSCKMCSHGKERNKKFGMKDMEMNLFMDCIDQISKFPPKLLTDAQISLSGYGEPLMCKKIIDMAKYARGNLPEYIKINLNTNGIFLTSKKAKELIKWLDRLLISINAPNKRDYQKLMGRDKFDDVIGNTKNLLKIREESNMKHFIVFLQLFEMFKIEKNRFAHIFSDYVDGNVKIYIRPLRSVPKKSISKKMVYDSVDRMLKREMRIQEPCSSLIRGIAIDVDGNIYPCCRGLWCRENSDLSLGNINEISILDAFQEKKRQIEFLNQKHNIFGEQFKSCAVCDSFALDSSPYINFKGLDRWF